jgi:uncharacterized protein (TIGR00297 family)
MVAGASLTNVAIGGIAAAAVALVALRVRALDRGGAFAAFAVGTATFGTLGLPGSYVLLAFFVSSVALSRVGKARKRAALVDVDKTGARDALQVFANGGVAALCAIAAAFVDARFAAAFAGAFAAAAADTWATEVGTLVKQPPRSILTLRPIATGLSGGVTFAGTAAEIAGAAFIALVALAVVAPAACAAVFAGGVAGAVTDSLLGASLQSLRWCPQCDRATERDPHVCGSTTKPRRGFGWFGNDAVNLSATIVGAGIAFAGAALAGAPAAH